MGVIIQKPSEEKYAVERSSKMRPDSRPLDSNIEANADLDQSTFGGLVGKKDRLKWSQGD